MRRVYDKYGQNLSKAARNTAKKLSHAFANGTTLDKMPDGFYVALVGSGDWWTSAETGHVVPWSTHTISDFKGWYRAREAGRWVFDTRSFYPFTASNCMARRYTAANISIADAVALEPDAPFRIEENGKPGLRWQVGP